MTWRMIYYSHSKTIMITILKIKKQMRLPFEIHLGAAALNFLVEAVELCTL